MDYAIDCCIGWEASLGTNSCCFFVSHIILIKVLACPLFGHFSYRNMGLATVQSREQKVRIKVMKEMNRSGVEAMRSKIGMKSNVIRNLPKNVPY